MGTVRLIGRGLSDTLEHLLAFSLLTLGWWVAVLLVVPGPGATLALFGMVDPRRAIDRPEWRDAVRETRRNLRRGWALALLAAPLPGVLLWNLSAYAYGSGRFGWLVPLWLLMLGLLVAAALYACAVTALMEQPAWDALKGAAALVGFRPGRALATALVSWLLVAIGGALVVPLVMFVPALLAALVNRVVLDGLGVPVPDPLAPTEERAREERTRRVSKFGP